MKIHNFRRICRFFLYSYLTQLTKYEASALESLMILKIEYGGAKLEKIICAILFLQSITVFIRINRGSLGLILEEVGVTEL